MSTTKPVQSGSSEVQILRALFSRGEEFTSGEELAQSLHFSRVAIWKKVEKLRKQGYTIEAVRRKGYRMSPNPGSPTGAGVLARTDPRSGLRSLYFFDDNPSTNDAAFRLLAEGAETPFACVTRRQPKGKGRRGRTWSGDLEGNVYATVAARPMISPRTASLLPIRAGLNLCRRLRAETNLGVQLKWPNDLLVRGRKIAGMLAESTFDTERVTALVFGVGLNVNVKHHDLGGDLRASASSLAIESGGEFSLEALTAAVLEEVLLAIREIDGGIDEDRLADDWKDFAAFQGETVSVNGGDGKSATGILSGIDRSGSLLLRTTEGGLRSFRAGDVSLRSAE